jgi:hypothetical protein
MEKRECRGEYEINVGDTSANKEDVKMLRIHKSLLEIVMLY